MIDDAFSPSVSGPIDLCAEVPSPVTEQTHGAIGIGGLYTQAADGRGDSSNNDEVESNLPRVSQDVHAEYGSWQGEGIELPLQQKRPRRWLIAQKEGST